MNKSFRKLSRNFMKAELTWKFTTIIFALVGLVVVTAYVQTGIMWLKSYASTSPIVKFELANYALPSTTPLKLMVDSGGHTLGFVHVEITFDRSKIRLSQDPIASPLLKRKVQVTTASNANSTGKIIIALGLDPLDKANPPSGSFELASLSFVPNTTLTNQSSTLTFSANTMQIVETNYTNLIFTTTNSTLNINPVSATNTQAPTTTNSPTPTGGPTPPSSGVPCSSLSGIERRFPCSPLVIGPMPENVTSGADAWDMFTNILYPGTSNGVNERFSAVANPAGSGVVIRNQNLLSDSEGHTTVGTGRSLPVGTTECSAFRWLWKDASEFTQRGWVLVWQLQMSGSPIVAIQTDQTTNDWYFRTRNGSDSGLSIRLGDVLYGHWAYFTVCTHLAEAPNGWTKVWFKNDNWPDVNAAPFYQRSGHDTYQGQTGHNTIGIYAGRDGSSTSYYGYFDRYGRATTPARAVEIAGNPTPTTSGTTSTPTPTYTTPPSSGNGIWISQSELMTRPTSGSAWQAILSNAGASWGSANVSDQDSNHDQMVLAGSFVCARTGQYCDKTTQGLLSAIDTENGARWLAIGRNVLSYTIAADVMKNSEHLAGTDLNRVNTWLARFLTRTLRNNNGSNQEVLTPFESGSNASAQEGAVYAAIAAYTKNMDKLNYVWNRFRLYSCDRANNPEQTINLSTGIGGGWSFTSDPNQACAVNPKGSTKDGHRIDGAVINDIVRGGSFQWPPGYTGYEMTGLQGYVPAAVLFHKAGFPSFTLKDQAVLRAMDYVCYLENNTTTNWWETNRGRAIMHLVKVAYNYNPAGCSYSYPVGDGMTIGYTDWTHPNGI